jgi:ATP-dependent DNA ligase
MPYARRPYPQLSTRTHAVISSVDWLFEPAWRGDRLLARVDGDDVELTDRFGKAVEADYPEALEVLAASVDADEALLDGIWTALPFVGVGSAAYNLAQQLAEEGVAEEYPDPIANESRRAYVAIDLLELDGQLLYEVPYLERRRLLESVIDENVRVRITPAVRVPVEHWLHAWRLSGFTHYVAKQMNSRYVPGEPSNDWLEIPAAPMAGEPGMMGRLIGMRGPRKAKIGDAPRR